MYLFVFFYWFLQEVHYIITFDLLIGGGVDMNACVSQHVSTDASFPLPDRSWGSDSGNQT